MHNACRDVPPCLQGQGLPPQRTRMTSAPPGRPGFQRICFFPACPGPLRQHRLVSLPAALCRIRPVFPHLSCPSLTLLVFISFRRPTLVEQLSFLNFLLFDEVRVWEVLEDCLKGSVRFMCRTRQKNNNLILLSLEKELSSLHAAPLLPYGWKDRKSILPPPPCISRAHGCYSL